MGRQARPNGRIENSETGASAFQSNDTSITGLYVETGFTREITA